MSALSSTWVNLILSGDPHIGLIYLTNQWWPAMTPFDGYHIYYSKEIIECRLSEDLSPLEGIKYCNCEIGSRKKKREKKCSSCKKLNRGSKVGVELEKVRLQMSLLRAGYTGETTRGVLVADVVALCYLNTDRESFKNAFDKWYPLLLYHCPNVPVVLVGLDGRREDDASAHQPKDEFVSSEEGRRAAHKIGAVQFLESSILVDETHVVITEVDFSWGVADESVDSKVSLTALFGTLARYGCHHVKSKGVEEVERSKGNVWRRSYWPF